MENLKIIIPALILLVGLLSFLFGPGIINRIKERKKEKNSSKPKINPKCQSEIDYFLRKEVLFQGRRFTYKWYVDIYKERMEKSNLQFDGPSCQERNGKYIISYHVHGKSNDGKLWDHFAEFEVNSKTDEIKPISSLAKTMVGVLSPKKR